MENYTELLYTLAKTEKEIDGMDKAINSFLDRLEVAKSSFLELKNKVSALEEEKKSLNLELRKVESRIDEINSRLKKENEKLYQVKSEKEYNSISAEIETLKKKKEEIDEQELKLLEKLEKLEEQLHSLKTEVAQKTTEIKQLAAETKEKIIELKKKKEESEKNKKILWNKLPQDLKTQYKKLKEKHGSAISYVDTKFTCSICNFNLPPSMLEALSSSKRHLLNCPHCKSFLFWTGPFND